MQQSRPNFAISVVVNEGLALEQRTNKYIAAHYMYMYGVSFRVIVRVLGAHGRRRSQCGQD